MKLKTLLTVAFAALLAGCASGGMKHSEMKDSMPSVQAGSGRIFFYRTASMFGAALQPDIQLIGIKVGASTPGGVFSKMV
jgi:hypothetical protein